MSLLPTKENFTDALSKVVELLRPSTFMFRAIDAAGDWNIRYPSLDGLRCYAVQKGAIWMQIEGEDSPRRLEEGSCIVLTRRQIFSMGSLVNQPPEDAVGIMNMAQWGGVVTINGGGEVSGLGGFFIFKGQHANLFLDSLPSVMYFQSLSEYSDLSLAMGSIMNELREPKFGSRLVVDQTALSMLVFILRRLLDQGTHAGHGWLLGLSDPKIGRAIQVIHTSPSFNWTLELLAQEAGMSRSSFAVHFRRLVGEPPMSYLQRWRMSLATYQLLHSKKQINDIAYQVGYESVSAFCTAFKKVMGYSPTKFRNQE